VVIKTLVVKQLAKNVPKLPHILLFQIRDDVAQGTVGRGGFHM